jgi:GxxExxY protein
MDYTPLSHREEEIGKAIVEAALRVHRALGPGLLEGVYEVCFCHELTKLGHQVRRQVLVPIIYDGMVFEETLRLDVLVDELAICELKAVDKMELVFQAQLLSYLRLAGKRLGFLINFNVPILKQGIKRMII